jgi:hypothetical protein
MALTRKVDHSALRTHQAIMIAVLLVAFIANLPLLVGFIAVVMVIGAAYPPARLFVLFYQQVLKPAGIVKPDVIVDNPEPHRFAMALGGVFATFSFLALLADVALVGWTLTLVVVVLAAVNLFLGICVGCLMYYQLNKFGVPGFNQAPIQGSSV